MEKKELLGGEGGRVIGHDFLECKHCGAISTDGSIHTKDCRLNTYKE